MTQCAYVDPSSAPCLFDDKGHRPYQGQNRKDHSPSITTVSGMIDDGKASAFGFAGAEIAAVTAVHDGWGKLVAETTCSRSHKEAPGLCPACSWIRGEHQRRWDTKAALGTHCHHMAAQWWAGEDIVVDSVTGPIMDSLEQFVHDLKPEIELAEFTVLHDTPKHQMYRGQGDTLGTLLCPVCKNGERCSWIWDNKGLAVDTPIPTPTGWALMADLSVGDEVLDSQGRPCHVTAKSAVHERPCYRLRFDDGSHIICDDEHRWAVLSGRSDWPLPPTVRSAKEIAESLVDRRGQCQHRVLNTRPLELPTVALPLDPYLLGVWLGDGTRGRSVLNLSAEKRPIMDAFSAAGFTFSKGTRFQFGLRGFRPFLRSAGFIDPDSKPVDKHIPAQYLRASAGQRLALLQGLMDTDGCWNKVRDQAIYTTVNDDLCRGVHELVVSLGWRASVNTHPAHGFGLTITAHTVIFTPLGVNPFRLVAHKRDAAQPFLEGKAKSRRRIVQAVEPIATVPTQCIGVDSPDHTYLCGEQMIPTHNCGDYYPKEQTLQVAAQRYAAHLTDWSDGTERIVGPMPRVAHAGVLLLSAQGYRLVPLPVDQTAFNSFLRLRDTWAWLASMSAWDKAHPLPAPTPFSPSLQEASK